MAGPRWRGRVSGGVSISGRFRNAGRLGERLLIGRHFPHRLPVQVVTGATPRQRLSEDERERRLDDAIGRFVNDVIPLGYAPDEVQARVAHEFQQLVPRKIA